MVQITETLQLIKAVESMGIEATVKACRKPPLPTRILREIYDEFGERSDLVQFVATYPLVPSDLAERMTRELAPDSAEIAAALAANPRTPQPALNQLARHPSAAVRSQLAANPNLTTREFQLVVKDESFRVRAALSLNASLPPAFQFYLATDEIASVRIALAGRRGLDSDITLRFATDDNPLVRAAALSNPDISDEVRQLWSDLDDKLNQEILLTQIKTLPKTAAQSLHFSADTRIHLKALEEAQELGPAVMLWLSESDDTQDRLFLAGYEKLPTAIQRKLAHDPASRVRKRLASNINLHESIALEIAASEDRDTCTLLATNPSLSADVLLRLCEHPEDAIAELITSRSDLKEVHYHALFNNRESYKAAELLAFQNVSFRSVSPTIATHLANSSAQSLRAFAATTNSVSPEHLARLSRDHSQAVRLAVAENENTPQRILHRLSADPIRKIVFSAEDTLSRVRRMSPTL